MLVAWDQPNCGYNCKVVKDLHALFVLGSRCSCREKSDVILQIAAGGSEGADRALRLAGYQGAAEPVPILVMTLVEVSQQPANIGGLTANEVAIAFGRVGVAALAVPVEQPQGHQRIEEVAGTARMNAGPRLQRLEVERSFGENAEHVE